MLLFGGQMVCFVRCSGAVCFQTFGGEFVRWFCSGPESGENAFVLFGGVCFVLLNSKNNLVFQYLVAVEK